MHIPFVNGKLVIPPEERANERVAHGLPTVFVRSATPKKPRAPSPSVNSSNYSGVCDSAVSILHCAQVGDKHQH